MASVAPFSLRPSALATPDPVAGPIPTSLSRSSVLSIPSHGGTDLSHCLSIGGLGNWGAWRAAASFFPFLKKKKDTEALKEELLEAIAPLDRGADATEEDQERIDQIAQELESANTIKEPLNSDLLNGKWELIYTTSNSILARQRPKLLRPNGNIYQAINVDTLRAQNMETWPFFNQVTANLVPLNPRRVAVRFDTFKIAGLIPIKAPGRGRGELEITYLDEELRISRGDKGNLFILKMVDRSYRVPT